MSEKLSARLSTTVTAGGYFHIIIPDGSGYISKKIPFGVVKDEINLEDSANKGYFPNEAALVAAYPAGEPGWYAINGDTDTVWIWDDNTSAWIDTTNSGLVTSVNSQTGAVSLVAVDIQFTSLQGMTAVNVRNALDELKVAIDDLIAGTVGVNIYQTRQGKETLSPGTQTVTFEQGGSPSPFLDADYTLVPSNINDGNIDLENITQTANGFEVEVYSETVLSYVAFRNTTATGSFTDSEAIHDNVAGEINAISEKAVLVDDDLVIIEDSEDSYNKKKVKRSNLISASAPVSRKYISFTSGDLSGGVLSITHDLGVLLPSCVTIYNDSNEEVNKTNYIYKALTTTTGQITFYLPITGTWNGVLIH